MILFDPHLNPRDLLPAIQKFWQRSAETLDELHRSWDPADGAPVFTVQGKYTSQGWTEWTQGFQFGSDLLHFDATGDEQFYERARSNVVEHMAPHLTHMGVHDHGFNNVSTYGTIRRLILEGRAPAGNADQHRADLQMCELALKVSGAVQASRWTSIANGDGYIYSFNGPHSLFADTIRSLRALALAHQLGHRLLGENDQTLSLLGRLIQHAKATARFNVYYGEKRDRWDTSGRVAHESIFNTNDGNYRCPSSQQGYSPFTTWTRGAAWVVTGFAEQLEFLATVTNEELEPWGGREEIEQWMTRAAVASADAFIESTPPNGIPYWDTGAPELSRLGDWKNENADPFNNFEPVDSSAAAIVAQGFIRLGQVLKDPQQARRMTQAGLTTLKTLLSSPYLSSDPKHQGLLLHSIYHQPRGWDYVPHGAKIPHGESCMWGDYHLRELVVLVQRIASDNPYYTFFGP